MDKANPTSLARLQVLTSRDVISLASFGVPFVAYLISSGYDIFSAFMFAILAFEVRVVLGFAVHAWRRTKSPRDRLFIWLVCAILGMAALALVLQFSESVACNLHPEFMIFGVACNGLSKAVLLAFLIGGYCFTAVSISVFAVSLAAWRRYSFAADLMAIRLVALIGSSTHGFYAVALTSFAIAVIELFCVWQGLDEILFLVAFNLIMIAVGLVVSNTRLPRVAFEGRKCQRGLQRSHSRT